MSDPADLINVAVEQLVVERFELPAYGTLDEFVNHIRHQAHEALYAQVTSKLTEDSEGHPGWIIGQGKRQNSK